MHLFAEISSEWNAFWLPQIVNFLRKNYNFCQNLIDCPVMLEINRFLLLNYHRHCHCWRKDRPFQKISTCSHDCNLTKRFYLSNHWTTNLIHIRQQLCTQINPEDTFYNCLEFYNDNGDGDNDDDEDDPDAKGKQWHGMDRAISFCTHTMHTDERPDTLMRTMTMIVIFAYVIISSSVCYNVAMLMFV